MAWPERLDAMERQLREADHLLAGGSAGHLPAGGAAATGEPLPPADGPIPPHLRQRAAAILAATRQAETDVQTALGRVGDRLDHLRASLPRGGALTEHERPAYVDIRA